MNANFHIREWDGKFLMIPTVFKLDTVRQEWYWARPKKSVRICKTRAEAERQGAQFIAKWSVK